MKIKQLVILMALVVATSGVAYAAQDDTIAREAQEVPYVTAPKTGVVAFEENGAAKIVQDMFVAAANTPLYRAPAGTVARSMRVTSTGYNSEVAQTDSSPFIAADGTHVYWGMVAANFLPFGTKIKIPDYYGDKVFVVHDRMNKRFSDRVDVWFEHKPEALKWGRRSVEIEILGS